MEKIPITHFTYGKIGFCLLVLVATIRCTTTAPIDFIRASCKTTLHPPLCVRCLSSYAGSIQGSDHHLAKAAVTVSLNDAKLAADFVSKLARVSGLKPREYQAVKDCISTMTNSVVSLSQSVQELERMGRWRTGNQDFEWHMSNVETWVSSALTNQNICSGGFGVEGHVKDVVTKRMVYASQGCYLSSQDGVIELDRPPGRKAEKRKRKVEGKQTEEIMQFRKMKHILLEESRAQEKEFYRLKVEKMEYDKKKGDERLSKEAEKLRLEVEKMEYDKKKENERLSLEAEKLKLEAEKMEFAKKESDQRIMMMDSSVMPEMQRLYIQDLQREIIMRRGHD